MTLLPLSSFDHLRFSKLTHAFACTSVLFMNLAMMLAGVSIGRPAHAIPIVTNGSLTGPVDGGSPPPSWPIVNGTPDTNDIDSGAFGDNAATYSVTASNSIDGGTWAGALGRFSGSVPEEFGQSVAGFTPGFVYEVSWEQAHFGGFSNTTIDEDGHWRLSVSGVGDFSGATMVLGDNWEFESINFVATSSSHSLDFLAVADSNLMNGFSYILIDGIGVQLVPEPSTGLLLALGLIGLATRRRGGAN